MIAFNNDVYNALKFLHVLAAIAWVGSAIYVQVLVTRVLREGDPDHVGMVARDIGVAGKTLLMPASIAALVFGIALIVYSPAWNFGQTWVLIGLGGIAATIVTGTGFLGPESERLGRLFAEGHTSAEPEVERRIRKIVAISRVDLVVLVLVVADMVFKPGA